jgi:hypothetical protein
MTRILTRKHVEGLLTIREVIEAVELAHADLTNHLAIQPAPRRMPPIAMTARGPQRSVRPPETKAKAL